MSNLTVRVITAVVLVAVLLTVLFVLPARAAMFEDDPRNLAIPHALGMRTVLVADLPESAAHIHHHTNDLTGFLTDLALPVAQVLPQSAGRVRPARGVQDKQRWGDRAGVQYLTISSDRFPVEVALACTPPLPPSRMERTRCSRWFPTPELVNVIAVVDAAFSGESANLMTSLLTRITK